MLPQLKLPIDVQPLFDLQKVVPSLEANALSPTKIKVDGRYICVVTDSGALQFVNILSLENTSQPPAPRAAKVDSALMHPTQPILAVTAGTLTQVFALTTPPKKLAENNDHQIEFWKWIDEQTIAVVTSQAVYHWTLSLGGTFCVPPEKIFDRLKNELVGYSINDYQVSHDFNFCALVGSGTSFLSGQFTGYAEVYSVQPKTHQSIPALACCFSKQKSGYKEKPILHLVKREHNLTQLTHIDMEDPQQKTLVVPVPDTLEVPLALVVSPKYSVLYMLTKNGFFFMFDTISGKIAVASQVVSLEPLLLAVPHLRTSGVIAISRTGSVFSVTVNEQNLVPWILEQMKDLELAVAISQRGEGLPGLEAYFSQNLQALLKSGKFIEAATLVAESPAGCLRTSQTLQAFKSCPTTLTSVPLRDYFAVMLEKGRLNEVETLEIIQPVIAQGRVAVIADWFKDEKLCCSPAVGTMIHAIDPNLALQILEKCEPDDLALYLLEIGDFVRFASFAQTNQYKPDWMSLYSKLLHKNPQSAVKLAEKLYMNPSGRLIEPTFVVESLIAINYLKEACIFLSDIIKDTPDNAALQTRYFEIHFKMLSSTPNHVQVLEALFQNGVFSHYDKQRIRTLCTAHGLHKRALQHASNAQEVRDCIIAHGQEIPADMIVEVFQRFSQTKQFELIGELLDLAHTQTQLLGLVASVSSYLTLTPMNPLSPLSVLQLFEDRRTTEGSYLYLQQILSGFKNNKTISFKYIEAASKLSLTSEVEDAVRDLDYDPHAVREFLTQGGISCRVPLAILCKRFNLVVPNDPSPPKSSTPDKKQQHQQQQQETIVEKVVKQENEPMIEKHDHEHDREKDFRDRFTDGGAEPGKIFNAIDIRCVPLVSLDDALKPLQNFVPDLSNYLGIAFMWAESLEQLPYGLSLDVAACLNLYTREWTTRENSLYYRMNAALRSENREAYKPYLLYIRLFWEGYRKLPRFDAKPIINRGMRDVVSPKLYAQGKRIIWWGFSSCTTELQTLSGFLGGGGGNTPQPGTLFHIQTTSSRSLRDFSVFPTESEVVLLPGIYLEVTGVLAHGGLTIIEMKEIKPRAELFIPPD